MSNLRVIGAIRYTTQRCFGIKDHYKDLLDKKIIEEDPKQASLIDYLAEQTSIIENTHTFWLDNKDKISISSNKAEIEAKKSMATKKNWLNSLKGLFDKEEETQPVKTDKIEKYISSTPFVHDKAIRGSYIWGDTGSGKTFLCDLFFDNLNIKEKQRFHYNKFMLKIHQSNFKYYNVA